ncbi:hypothetical protein E2C01_077875 [Portunus trituberculatus]|uniref:Uncharacterized protein n=1 Tax=Portunus trituberculatus TaxID=210409 RepID=A0A5B7INE5_PORTR|nr:hypothetical protein [Portunus trituberculatus]
MAEQPRVFVRRRSGVHTEAPRECAAHKTTAYNTHHTPHSTGPSTQLSLPQPGTAVPSPPAEAVTHRPHPAAAVSIRGQSFPERGELPLHRWGSGGRLVLHGAAAPWNGAYLKAIGGKWKALPGMSTLIADSRLLLQLNRTGNRNGARRGERGKKESHAA